MDQAQLQAKIAEYYAKLPTDAQVMFSKMEWLSKIQGISSRYNMTDTQIQTLGTETSLVMLGIIHPDEYEKILKTELAVPREIGIKIVDDINQEILQNWRDILIETHKNNMQTLANETYGAGKTLDERFSTLPQEVQQAITETNYQETLTQIGTTFKLTIEQIGALEVATTKMMLGIIHPENYESEVVATLGLSTENGKKVADAVNEKILKNIRSILIRHSEELKAKESPEEAVPKPPYVEVMPNISTPPVSINEASAPVLEAQAVAKINMVPQTEGGVMSSAGIELVTDEVISPEPKINTAPTEQQVQTDRTGLAKSGINVVAEPNASYKDVQMKVNKEVQEETLSGIENPPKLSSSIIGQKLSGALINTNTSTNRSPLPTIIRAPIGTPAPDTGASGAPHGNDQYREQV